VLSIFAQYGFSLPHSSAAQSNYGRRISASELQPGDLLFYGRGGRSIGHVAIYIGGGQIVHASDTRTGIRVSNAFYTTPVCCTSLLD
ncbi:MAG: C40 family peptidase, partial [Lachnospiraceae bacterium]|nr:C40 family peptidase [Lachnospiraceae bacterium]